jgi:hypothetical protein
MDMFIFPPTRPKVKGELSSALAETIAQKLVDTRMQWNVERVSRESPKTCAMPR